jgi:hypothetical protein
MSTEANIIIGKRYEAGGYLNAVASVSKMTLSWESSNIQYIQFLDFKSIIQIHSTKIAAP